MADQKTDTAYFTKNEQLEKLNSIVVNAIEEEKLLSQKLYQDDEKNFSIGNKAADAIASFGGSWKFIIIFILFLTTWIVINLFLFRSVDPYPFILLNLLLSAIAAIQAPIIMMSQNRKEEKDRQRATGDYLINLKDEIEIRNLHQKVDLLISEQMQTLLEIQKTQMELMEEIRISSKKQGQ